MGDGASSEAGCSLVSVWVREGESEWYVKGSGRGEKDTPPCLVEIKGALAARVD